MGLTQSKNNTESINWDKLDTEAMSSTLPTLKKINKDAENLISQLNIENNVDYEATESDDGNIFTWLKNMGEEKPQENKKPVNNEENFSDTSPFISSDMYRYLVEKNSEEKATSDDNQPQRGGAIKDDSSTSSTSSSNRKPKKNNKITTESSVMSGGDLSYISSSAHTDDMSATEDNKSTAYEESTISVGNNRILTSSIRTSDINLVSAN